MSLSLWNFLQPKTTTSITRGLKPNLTESNSIKRMLNDLAQLLLWGEEIQKINVVPGLSCFRNYSYNAHPPSHVAFFEKYRQHFENICFDWTLFARPIAQSYSQGLNGLFLIHGLCSSLSKPKDPCDYQCR